jgi:hypothetical protein
MTDNVVKISLVVDETGAVKALRGAGTESERAEGKFHKLDKEVKGLGKSFGGLKSMIGMGIGALGVGGLAVGLEGVVSNTKEALTQTEKFSAISGAGAQQSLYLTAALKARGINAELAGKAFSFLGSNIKTAEKQESKYTLAQGKAAIKGKLSTSELGKQALAFKQLFGAQGVGALAGLSGEDKLKKVVKAFEDLSPAIKKTGAQAALMKEVFGKGGTGLATVLQGGATGLTHFEEVAKRFFPQLKGGTKGVEEWATKNSEFHMGLEGLETTLGMKLIPVLMSVEEWFTKTAGEVEKGSGPWGKFGKDLEGVYNAGKSVVGFMEGLGKAFNIKIGSGGLGAALMAFAGIKTAKKVSAPVKATKAIGKDLLKAGKKAAEHPWLAAPILGAAAGTALSEATPHGLFPGAETWSPFGGRPPKYKPGGLGKAAAGAMTSGEASLVSSLLEHPNRIKGAAKSLTPQEAQMIGEAFARAHKPIPVELKVSGDGPLAQAFAQAIIHDSRAARVVAESTAKYAQSMVARK